MPSSRSRLTLIGAAVLATVLVAGGTLAVLRPWEGEACPPHAEHPEWTVARHWNESLLGAIRRALPAPRTRCGESARRGRSL